MYRPIILYINDYTVTSLFSLMVMANHLTIQMRWKRIQVFDDGIKYTIQIVVGNWFERNINNIVTFMLSTITTDCLRILYYGICFTWFETPSKMLIKEVLYSFIRYVKYYVKIKFFSLDLFNHLYILKFICGFHLKVRLN